MMGKLLTKLNMEALKESSFLQDGFIKLIVEGKVLENISSLLDWLYDEETHFVEFSFVRFDLLEKSEIIQRIKASKT